MGCMSPGMCDCGPLSEELSAEWDEFPNSASTCPFCNRTRLSTLRPRLPPFPGPSTDVYLVPPSLFTYLTGLVGEGRINSQNFKSHYPNPGDLPTITLTEPPTPAYSSLTREHLSGRETAATISSGLLEQGCTNKLLFPGLYGGGDPHSVIVQLAATVGPALGTILGAWLQARLGRKVKLKFRDVELEASNLDELGRLAELVKQYSQDGLGVSRAQIDTPFGKSE